MSVSNHCWNTYFHEWCVPGVPVSQSRMNAAGLSIKSNIIEAPKRGSSALNRLRIEHTHKHSERQKRIRLSNLGQRSRTNKHPTYTNQDQLTIQQNSTSFLSPFLSTSPHQFRHPNRHLKADMRSHAGIPTSRLTLQYNPKRKMKHPLYRKSSNRLFPHRSTSGPVRLVHRIQ